LMIISYGGACHHIIEADSMGSFMLKSE
jgi:hypothetical protein